MRLRRYVTIGDAALIATLLVAAVAALLVVPGRIVAYGTEVEIYAGDRVAGRYSLENDRLVEVEGPLGQTIVEIKDGRARILDSPCPHKLCTKMGHVGREGGIVACVPNRIVLSVGKQRADGLDAVSR